MRDVNAGATVGNIIRSNGVVGAAILGNNVKTGDIINVGTINFNGAGISNSIQNALAVNFQAAGQVTLTKASSAGTFTIAQGGTVVNDGNGVTGNVVAGDGQFNSNIDGGDSVNDGTITGGVSQNATITGTGQINGSVGGNAAVNAGQLTGDVTGNTTVTTGQMTGNTGGTLFLGAGHVFGNVGSSVTFTAERGALDTTTVGGPINFNSYNSTVTVADTGSLTSVTSSTTTAGNVGFAAEANVTGAINNISTIVIQGATGKTVTFGDDISVASLSFTNGGTADLKGSLAGSLNFGTNGGILQFSGTNSDGYSFNSAVTNGQNGTLNVYTNLTSTDASIGEIKTINIGQLGKPNAINILVNQPALSLLAASGSISFNDPDSTLNILPGQAQTIKFNGNLDGTTGTGDGILDFDATNGALKLQGATGNETVGETNRLKAINLVGANTITLLGGANQLSFTKGAAALTIGAGTTFVDQSVTSASISAITIGAAGDTGAGTYILDAVNNNFILTDGLTFGNQDSVLQLQTSIGNNGNSLITLGGDINPGAANTGIIKISSVNAGATLTINGVYNVGIAAGNTVQSIDFSGAGSIVMTDPDT